MVRLQALRPQDIDAVLDIQSRCYDAAKLESAQSFLAKLRASPTSCFMAWMDDLPAGYLVAMPADAMAPPALHSETCELPAAADGLYLHDLAVHPRARRRGVAEVLIDAYFQARQQLDLRFACLTAVNGSAAFWERHGFRTAAAEDALSVRLASYGEGACYMRQDFGR